MAAVKQVLCEVGKQVYGIDLKYVNGIEKYVDIISVPNAPSYIEGIINLRGDVIPVFSIHDRFNQPKTAVTEKTKLIVTRSHDMLIAFMVDEVSEIVEVDDSECQKAPIVIKSEATSYIKNIIKVRDELVVVFDVDGILTEMEQQQLQDLVEAHQ